LEREELVLFFIEGLLRLRLLAVAAARLHSQRQQEPRNG
jgi:hypothetical protein